jgi:hypothetical protein
MVSVSRTRILGTRIFILIRESLSLVRLEAGYCPPVLVAKIRRAVARL